MAKYTGLEAVTWLSAVTSSRLLTHTLSIGKSFLQRFERARAQVASGIF